MSLCLQSAAAPRPSFQAALRRKAEEALGITGSTDTQGVRPGNTEERASQAAWGVRSAHTFKHRLSPVRWPRQHGVFILRVSWMQASGTTLPGHSPRSPVHN